MSSPLVILGCGYVGARIAKAARASGRSVRVCARGTARMQPLGELGAEVKFLDATTPKQFTTVCASNAGGTVIYSIPPVTALPPGHALRAALQAAYGGGAACFILFSSCGLYGDEPDDDVWVDEDTPLRPDQAMHNIQSDELEMERCTFDRMKLVTLRLAPVYGPGRGVRNRIRKGDYRILDDGLHVTSRIHVDDVVRVVTAAEEKAPHRSVFLLGDDAPTTQGEYAKWLAARMKVPMPPHRQMVEPGKAKVAHRNRKIRNARMKQTLGLELLYPSFREGEAAIEAEEAGA